MVQLVMPKSKTIIAGMASAFIFCVISIYFFFDAFGLKFYGGPGKWQYYVWPLIGGLGYAACCLACLVPSKELSGYMIGTVVKAMFLGWETTVSITTANQDGFSHMPFKYRKYFVFMWFFLLDLVLTVFVVLKMKRKGGSGDALLPNNSPGF